MSMRLNSLLNGQDSQAEIVPQQICGVLMHFKQFKFPLHFSHINTILRTWMIRGWL